MESDYNLDNEVLLDEFYEYEDIDGFNDDDNEAMLISEYNSENNAVLALYRAENHDLREEMSSLVFNCMGTVVKQSLSDVVFLFLICFFLRLICFLINSYNINNVLSTHIQHFISFCLGVYVLHGMFNDIFFHLLGFILFLLFLNYVIIFIFRYRHNCGLITSFITIFYILLGEFMNSNTVLWNRIRGVLLLMAMKIISVSFDHAKKQLINFPNIIEYSGYCFHPGTIVFGPWISIHEYTASLLEKRSFNLNWCYSVVRSFCQSYICLLLCDCVLSYLFIDESNVFAPAIFPFIANQWLISYETAVSFHFSHFYVSYLATSTCLLSGVGGVKENLKNLKCSDQSVKTDSMKKTNLHSLVWSKFKITKPLSVEIPFSMLNVVTAWNIPMSVWLKAYVFNSSRFLGDFMAVLFTYVASALLHGLSFRLAAILLSLGFYTYIEYVLRKKIARIFNCSFIQSRPKKTDGGIYAPFWAKIFNFMWIIINLMHLAYLGSMFIAEDEDSRSAGYSIYNTLAKWSELSYTSHIFAFACFVFNWLI